MRYFRHPALAFYALAVLAALGLLIGAFVVGRSRPVSRPSFTNALATDAQVEALRYRMTDLSNLLAVPSQLRRWGAVEATMADADALTRQHDLGHSDSLVVGLHTLAVDSRLLGTAGYDTLAAIGRVEDDGDALTRLATSPNPATGEPHYQLPRTFGRQTNPVRSTLPSSSAPGRA